MSSQSVPRVNSKKVGLQTIDWVDPKELNVFLNVLNKRIEALEAEVAALKAA